MNTLDPSAQPSPDRGTGIAGPYPMDPAQMSYETSGPVNLETLRGIAWRQRYLLIGIVAAALVIGFVATLLMTPMYTATASARIDPESTLIVEGQDIQPEVATNEISRYMTTLAAVVETQAMALQVVDALKLDRDPAFAGTDEDRPAGLSDRQWQAQRRDQAASTLRGGVSAEVPLDERILFIGYQSPDPQMSARIANTYLELFLVDDVRRGLEKSAYAQNFLQQQIVKTRGELEVAERRALAYARANGIVSPTMLGTDSGDGQDSAAPQTITAANLASTNQTYSEARAARIAAEQRWRSVAATPASQIAEVQQNAAIQTLTSEKARQSAQLADLSTRYGPLHPQVVEAKAQIASLDRQIASLSGNIKTMLRKDYEIARQRENALSGELARVSGETLDEQDRRVQFNQLDREAQALRTQLRSLLDRFNQVSAAANLRTGTATKLDEARVPAGPSSPNMLKNLLVALVLGGAAAIGLAMMRELLDDRLRSAEDVERKLGLPLLGITPEVQGDDVSIDDRSLDEAYSSIRTSLDFALPNRSHNVIQVTSSQSGEGKTTTSVSLAEKYARLGRKVLLVDGDLRKPSVGSFFGVSRGKKGVAEVLLGTVPFEEALLPQTRPNLDVLPMGEIPANPVDVLSSQHLVEFIETMRQRYDLVLVDAPPVVGLADAPLLSRLVDGTVFIVESNRAHYGAVKSAVRRLRASDATILGVVLTKFIALDAGLSYDYQYSYYAYGANNPKKA